MKFAQHLSAHITPEWRKQYIQYDDMKAIIYDSLAHAPPEEEPERRAMYIQRFEEEFLAFCWQQLETINSFFKEKLAEASRAFLSLKTELSFYKDDVSAMKPGRLKFLTLNKVQRKKSDFELALSELYLKIVLLQNYQNLNHTGFRKILKKHDKVYGTFKGKAFMDQHVETAEFFTNDGVDVLIYEIEELVTHRLQGGDRAKAMKKLRVPPLGNQNSRMDTFLFGLFVGITVIVFVEVVSSAAARVDGVHFDINTLIRLYRGPFLLSLYIFLLGLNIHFWNTCGVNHVLIFEFDPRNHLVTHDLLEIAMFLTCVWLGSALVFLEHEHINVPLYASPLALLVFYAVFLFNPTPTFWRGGRIWFLQQLWRLFTSPCHSVSFADFWLADQLSSLTSVFLDLQYFICIFTFRDTLWVKKAVVGECLKFCTCNAPTSIIRPVLRWLPSFVRIIQCLRRWHDSKQRYPHLFNAGKYFCASVVILLSTFLAYYDVWYPEGSRHRNPLLYLWILASIVSSSYSFYWDVKMDWGFFDPNSGENKYLREEIVYRHKSFYYFAIVQDFILRFTWTISLTLTEVNYASADILMTVFAPCELFRRFIWNFFRLENEHLNNCGQFRAVRDISIVPTKRRGATEDVAEVLTVMDDQDGMEKVRRRKPSLSNLDLTDSQIKFEYD